MKKGNLILRTVLSTVSAVLGLAVYSSAAEEEPAIEREIVELGPLYFEGVDPSNEPENQRLWNELMKYKLWGTDSVVFNNINFKIEETSGYTGTAKDKVIFNNGDHTLGGPIISGKDLQFSYPNSGADNDYLLGGPVRAGWLVLPGWYSFTNVKYEGTYCFEHQVFFDYPDRFASDVSAATEIARNFIRNVHKSGGKIYADWDLPSTEASGNPGIPGLPGLRRNSDSQDADYLAGTLDGTYSECPTDVPQPDRNLTVPLLDESKIDWENADEIIMNSSYPNEIQYIQVPPITKEEANSKHTWYDKFVKNIAIGYQGGTSTGKQLYILMPSSRHNANGKQGRLTRVFSRDGFNFENSANDTKIRVVYVNKEAKWNDTEKKWDDFDLSLSTIPADSVYAGNLLFYTTKDIDWNAMIDIGYQGTFMTTGRFTIKDHMNLAGQLIAGKTLWFESDVNGRFHYVPFNSPEINTDVFVKDVFKEDNKTWHDMKFYLTDTAHTEVSFDYCFAFFGIDADTTGGKYSAYKSATGTFAEPADLGESDDEHVMPLCSKGESRHIVIKKGQRRPTVPEYSAYLKVIEDDKIEDDEYMIFRITNLNGAVISGNKFDGGLVVKIMDSDNKPPKFVDLDKLNLAVPENATKARAGKIKASDEENDGFKFEIVGGTAEDLFEIDPSSGVVTMKAGVDPFDYETWIDAGTKYNIEVEVCDEKATGYSAMLCDSRVFKISITDVNETPYFTYKATDKKEIKIAEDQPFSTDAVKFADTDIHNTDGLFTNNEVIAINGDTDYFDVTPAGYIYPKKGVVLDYETKNSYTITLRVRDATVDDNGKLVYPDLYDDMEFTIVVTDVDDGPKFDYKAYNGTVDENSIAGTEVDMDNAINATTTQTGAVITYKLLDETGSFEIDPSTGVITVATGAALDYETKSTYEMKVVASDEDKSKKNQIVQTDTATVVIKLNDLNEKPIFVEPTKTLTFPENKKGYEIGTLTFDDLDTASKFRNNKFECLECDELGFNLNPETGVLTTTRKFDYETEPKTYELTVIIQDASERADLVATGTITVELTNVYEFTELVYTVPESDSVGTSFKKSLEVDNVEGANGDLKFYILDGSKEVSATKEFKLNSKTGTFSVASPLDYETTESYSVRVRVKDTEGGYSDTTVTIKVIDVNEAPSVVVDTIYVSEDQVIKEPFSTVKTDKDDPDTKNADFRNNVYENTDKNDVVFVKSNGDVILLKPVDYEVDSVYTIMVRVTDKDDKTLTSTKKVVVKVKDVYEKSVVEITRVENKDSVYLKPTTIYVNDSILNVEWTRDGKFASSVDTVQEGCHLIIKTYKDPTKNDPGADTVEVCYSTAAPIVTVSANGEDVTADNIYTVVEKATKNDSAVYVNEKKNDIKVTVKDTAANVSKSFVVNVSLDTVSVSSKEFKNVQKIADTEVARKKDPASGITSVPENGDYYKNSYTETVNGVNVTVSYYTDKNGKDVKKSVITSSGKTKDIAVIEVSYTTKIDGKDVTISYYADASTGERVTLNTGLTDSESVLSADGEDVTGSYKVSYTYEDKKGNTVEVSYFLDEKGKIAKNNEGNIGYNVSYTYVNIYGNSSTKDVFIVLDQKGPVVKIESPTEDQILTSNFANVKWTVNGIEQDTLNVQGLDNGVNTIIRVFRDKAGNESRDSVHVMVKNVKNINIDVEKPVTLVSRDSVEKYYKENPPKKDQNYGVTFYNYKKGEETEALVGIDGKAKDGSGDVPYPGFDGHLGPTLAVDARVPVVSAVGGLATLDDIVINGGMIALDGVDAANSRKVSVEEYVEKYCTDEFKKSMTSDYSKMNLYWTTLKVKIWVYSNTGVFADYYSFDYDLDDPDYVNDAGLLKFYFEMKPDENGDVRTKDGRLYGTGAYLFKTEVKMTSKLRCDLPTSPDEDSSNKKKNAVIKSSDELLKSFGYRRPVNK
jgi:hypothetical protein